MQIRVEKDCSSSHKIQRQVAEIVVDAYWKEISLLCDSKDKMTAALQGCFNLEHFYIAYDGENAVGVAACSPPGHRAVSIDAAHLHSVLGDEIGMMASEIMKSEFESPLDFGLDTAYIEFVATAKSAQGKGVASQITKAILADAPYKRLVLEVADTNIVAIRLYEKFGFVEFERFEADDPQALGFNYRIYMEYIL